MKKKVLIWVLLLVVCVVFGVSLLVSWKPFEQLQVSEVNEYPLIRVTLGDSAGMRYTDPMYTTEIGRAHV